ncbi:MAG: hypothetical protein LBT22_02955, partial [Peptococcaceae bacterium]|nr:hypothetical protein [Peptococcaceae bacterium]
MGKEKGRALWEKDGDGDRMRLFFQREELDEETRERIKRLTERKLESLQQKEALGLAPFPAEQSGLKQGLKALLLSVWWRWRWKPVLLT